MNNPGVAMVASGHAEAADWFRQAAEGGAPEAMSNLAEMLVSGRLVEKDE